MGQERLGPSYFFISLVLGPLNSPRVDAYSVLELMMMPLASHDAPPLPKLRAADDDDVFYLFLQKQNRSRAPYIPLGRYVP